MKVKSKIGVRGWPPQENFKNQTATAIKHKKFNPFEFCSETMQKS
jgi:hypothetical protein